MFKTVGFAAIAALSLSACATSELGLPTSFDGIGRSADAAGKVTLAAAQVQGWCFSPPNRRDFDGILGEGAYLLELQNYNNNNNKYEVCRLKTPAQQLVAAAEVSKFSLVVIADALATIAEAEDLKSDTINQIAERLKATPATDINFTEENEKLATEIAKLQAEKSAREEVIELTPEAYTKIAVAEARLNEAASYLGQTLGTTIVIYRAVSQMNDAQRQAVYNQASGIYGGRVQPDAFNGFVGNIAQIAEGTISGASGLMTGAARLGDVEKPESVDDIRDAVEAARRVTNEDATKIVQQIDDGQLI